MLSFTDADRFSLGNKYIPSSYHYIGIRNYKDILTGSDFRQVAEFSVIWTFVNVFFHFTIGLGLALMLNRQLRFRGIYRMLLMVPWAVPSFISAFAWRFIYNNPYGFLDQFLQKLGWHAPARVSRRPDLGEVRRHRDERLARHPVHDGRAAGRAAGDRHRPARRRVGRRRRCAPALLGRHPARACARSPRPWSCSA